MQLSVKSTAALVAIGGVIILAPGRAWGQVSSAAVENRSRLAAVKPGTTVEKVIRDLGKPDEVRRIGSGGLLDGICLCRPTTDNDALETEAERWVYGPLGKGMFAATGYVSVSSHGTVISAVAADSFCEPGASNPSLVATTSDSPAKAPRGMVCRVVAVEPLGANGFTPERLTIQVKIANGGTKEFVIKHPAATDLRRLLVVEICDPKGVLLFRDNLIRYSSANSDGAPLTLSIPAGGEKSPTFCVSPATGFGRLPAGTYSLRVYFPLNRWDYYPSNRFDFAVTEAKKKTREDKR